MKLLNKSFLLFGWMYLPILIASHVHGQSTRYRDSLLRIIQRNQQDTAMVNTCYRYAESLPNGMIDSAMFYLNKGRAVAKQINYLKGVAAYASLYIPHLHAKGDYQQALALTEEALAIYQQLKDEPNMIKAYNNVGSEQQSLGNFKIAASNYLTALELAEKLKDNQMRRLLYNNLSSVFMSLDETQRSLEYANRGYELARQLNDKFSMASSLINVAAAEAQLGHYNQSFEKYHEVIALGKQLNDMTIILDGLLNLASIDSEKGRNQQALDLFYEARNITDTFQAPEHRMYALMGLSTTLHQMKRYQEADDFLQQTIALGKAINAGYELRITYKVAAENKEALNQLGAALAFRKLYETLNDSLMSDDTRKHVMQQEIISQTAIKDKDLAEKKLTITQKEQQLQAKNKWLIIIGLIMALLFVVAGIFFMKFRYRQKLHIQRLQTLRKEKEVQLLESFIQGEERERTRISKDLHDSVGGMLSAVKMHFSAIRQESESLRESPAFGHALGLLDEAVGEVRKTAHNLMPEMLTRYGLAEALQIFCKNISHAQTLQISFYGTGNIRRFKPNFELSVYRIVQELVNNIIKHSRATSALVQLSQHGQLLTITVEDNGVGFDQQSTGKNGMGLNSLQSRIRALNGSLEIEAATGQGTTAYIEFDTERLEVEVTEQNQLS